MAMFAVASFAVFSMSTSADAQMFSTQPTEPQAITLGVGGGVNTNMAFGTFNPSGGSGYMKGNWETPTFHISGEFPVAKDLMISPRLSYNDFSSVLDNNAADQRVPESQMIGYAYKTVGADLLLKYSFAGPAHLLVGVNASKSVQRRVATGNHEIAAAYQSNDGLPNSTQFYSAIEGGLGYDIPVSTGKAWITPEVTYAIPFMNISTGSTGDLRVNTLTTRITLKFAPF